MTSLLPTAALYLLCRSLSHLFLLLSSKTSDPMKGVDVSFPVARELEVARILHELPKLIARARTPFFALRWGAKRRRSAEEEAIAVHAPLPPSLRASKAEKSEVKAETSSPATPLSFSPSDTDCNSKPPRKPLSKTKAVKELTQKVTELSSVQEQLKLEISRVREHIEELKEANMKLKLKHSMVDNRLRLDLNLAEAQRLCADVSSAELAVGSSPDNKSLPMHLLDVESASAGLPACSNPASRGEKLHLAAIPDLNCAASEEVPEETVAPDPHFSDLNRAAMAAQARKRRMKINREKYPTASKLPRVR